MHQRHTMKQSITEPIASDFVSRMASGKARFIAFCLLLGGVFLMGGGSRGDIISLIALRPLAIAIAGYALLIAKPEQLRSIRVPLLLLSALAMLMVVQLVPLPTSVWSALPQRGIYLAIADDLGMGNVWRPMTLSPSRTINALFSLAVPAAALLVTAVQERGSGNRLILALATAGAISAVWGILQAAGPAGGPLYTYRITNNGFPVGPFANRNHLALLLSMLVVVIGYFYRTAAINGKVRFLYSICLGAAALVILALVLTAGSRAGLVLSVCALLVAGSLVGLGRRKGRHFFWGVAKSKFGIGLLLVVLASIGLTMLMGQATTLERVFTSGAGPDMRTESLPLVLIMVRDHWLVGIGFGAFEDVFKQYETISVLSPFIFNQAHNDWLQFPLEGGFAAIILLTTLLAWVVRRSWSVFAASGAAPDPLGIVLVAILGLTAVASLVDYPLRTPIVMFICATAIAMLARRTKPGKTMV